MKRQEIYQELEKNPKNVKFGRLCRAAELFGFEFKREKGSHRIYKREGIKELLNFQNVKGKGKPYQIRQFLKIIDDYGFLKE